MMLASAMPFYCDDMVEVKFFVLLDDDLFK